MCIRDRIITDHIESLSDMYEDEDSEGDHRDDPEFNPYNKKGD